MFGFDTRPIPAPLTLNADVVSFLVFVVIWCSHHVCQPMCQAELIKFQTVLRVAYLLVASSRAWALLDSVVNWDAIEQSRTAGNSASRVLARATWGRPEALGRAGGLRVEESH